MMPQKAWLDRFGEYQLSGGRRTTQQSQHGVMKSGSSGRKVGQQSALTFLPVVHSLKPCLLEAALATNVCPAWRFLTSESVKDIKEVGERTRVGRTLQDRGLNRWAGPYPPCPRRKLNYAERSHQKIQNAIATIATQTITCAMTGAAAATFRQPAATALQP